MKDRVTLRKGDRLAHALPICFYQREGMGLIKYQGHAFLRDVAHDGVSCTFSNRSAPDRGKHSVVRQGRRHGPSIGYKITP
jgi:hypothetical protein